MKARKKPRTPITAHGTCRNARGAQWDAVLSDIAEGGCRIADPAGQLAKGDQLRLTIAGTGPHHAQVCWRRGGAAGLAFLRPLPGELIERLQAGGHAAPAPSPAARPGFGRAATGPGAAPAPGLRRIL